MSGRPSLLTAEMQAKTCEYLRIGVTIENICDAVNISTRSYQYWRAIGEAIDAGERHPLMPKDAAQRDACLQFFRATTRAHAEAHVAAVVALRTGMTAAETRKQTVKTFSETRLRAGTGGEQVPYTYTRTERVEETTNHPPDWRAGIEYLRRRDAANWSDTQRVTITEGAMNDEEAKRILGGAARIFGGSVEPDELQDAAVEAVRTRPASGNDRRGTGAGGKGNSKRGTRS
ncbi:MAG: hypothetical protein SGJ24_04525 [Chloroflexota bacterium]|nr:hypothetical protein [Chloroflexota bacterium]